MTHRSPRVAIASRLFLPEVGAAAFRLNELASSLAATGSDVVVLTTRPPAGTEPAPRAERVVVNRAPALRDSSGNIRGYVQYLSFDIPLFFRLLFTRADVVVAEPPPTTGVVTAISSWIRRRPFVYYAADIWTDGLIALGSPAALVAIMRTVEGWVLRRAHTVLAVSDEVAEKVREFGVGADAVVTVGNGIDTAIFTPDGESERTEFPTFVYTGIMSEWQGPTVFVEALPLVRERFPLASIQFFGHGSETTAIHDTAERLGLGAAVRLGGVIPPRDAAKWLRGAAAALASITPGLGYDFAKPTKIYAAAACGTPVVFAGSGVASRLVDDNALGASALPTPRAVADAMIAVAETRSAADGAHLVEWVSQNASLSAAGGRAARSVLATIR